MSEPLRKQSKGSDPKLFPACTRCQERRVKCSNTLNETGFPCDWCKEKGFKDDCQNHLKDPKWRKGESGATNKTNARRRAEARQENAGQRHQKKPRMRATRKRQNDDGGNEDSDEEFHAPPPRRAPSSPVAGPSGRPIRTTRQAARYIADDVDDNVGEDEAGEDSALEEIVVRMPPRNSRPRRQETVEEDAATPQNDNHEPARVNLTPANTTSDEVARNPGAQLVLGVMRERLAANSSSNMLNLQRLMNMTLGRPAGAGVWSWSHEQHRKQQQRAKPTSSDARRAFRDSITAEYRARALARDAAPPTAEPRSNASENDQAEQPHSNEEGAADSRTPALTDDTD
ncbi:putative zn(2)-C6 fungal-type DNA-binding domain-containing protein [Septoria linicola]|nr:putative zn(2)-C6 fungal-type DNA-binding domain-containing protein [Septoria linicola]